ncbi:MAG: FliH/SctL family protein [Desulfovermiculus sp.]
MSRVLRGNISGLEQIQFRDLDSIPDTTEHVFEVLDSIPAEKVTTQQSPVQEEKQSTAEENTSSQEKSKPGQGENAGRKKEPKGGSKSKSEPKSEPKSEEAKQPEADAESIRAEAFAQGEAAGKKKMRADLDSALKAFSQAAQELNNARSEIFKRQSEDLVRLAMVVAEQVLNAELSLNEELVVSIVGKAMQSAFDSDEYHVRVHPEDVSRVQEHRPLLLSNVNGLRQIHVHGDANISRGGCVVESNKGQVDATLESKLAEIQEQLKQAVQSQ